MIPIDPKEQKRQEEELKLHRAAIVPMIAAMALVAAAAGYVFWDKMTRQPPPPRMPETMSRLEAHVYDDEYSPLDNPLTIRESLSVSDLIAQSAIDGPLDQEPANLTPFPDAVRVAGIERSGGSFVEQISVWRVIGASPDDVRRHYQRSAEAEGFVPIGKQRQAAEGAEPASAVHQVYWAPGENAAPGAAAMRSFGRILTLRIDPSADGSLRVLLDLTQVRRS